MSLATLTYPWQWRAWRFYGTDLAWSYVGQQGLPSSPMLSGPKINNGAVGEVRYTLGWVAMQVGRVGWNVTIDGAQVAEDQREALIAQVANQDTTVQIATNLIVAGELTYAAFDKTKLVEDAQGPLDFVTAAVMSAGPALPSAGELVWIPISQIFPNRPGVLQAADLRVRGVWPHPANPGMPDPPLRGVLDVLEELEQLTDVAWAQNNSRLAQMGILEVAKQYSFIDADEGSDFQTNLQLAIDARLKDPRQTGATPIVLVVDESLVGKGMAYTRFDPDPDSQLETKMKFAIQRLAWGFPVPPEILFGMTSTNRATAYQIEESTYEGNIEPIAQIVGRIYAAALAKLLARDDGTEPRVVFEPDPTALLARKSSVPDLQWAYVNGLISGNEVLSAMGLDPTDPSVLATVIDLERIKSLRAPEPGAPGAVDVPEDPTEQPAILAAASIAAAASQGIDLEVLTAELAQVDTNLLSSLVAATQRDSETAFNRLGAQIRTKARPLPDGLAGLGVKGNLRNGQLPLALGLEGTQALGIDVRASLLESYLPLVSWWKDQALPEANTSVRKLLLPLGTALPPEGSSFLNSAQQLLDAMVDWSLKQIEDQGLDEVPVDALRDVIATAGRV